MATMIDGETYLGTVLVRRLSTSKNVTLYLWPMRCLRNKVGGPTFGVDVGREEVLRFDCHGERGHWHAGGYDKLGAGGSHQDFPAGLGGIPAQIAWSLECIRNNGQQLLAEAGYSTEAASVDPKMVQAALDAIIPHIENQGALRLKAVAEGLVTD